MGVFETSPFDAGTTAVAKAIAGVKGTTIIGGGDSRRRRSRKAGVTDRITHISTGGGASLEFLGGQTLPGVAALTRQDRAATTRGRSPDPMEPGGSEPPGQHRPLVPCPLPRGHEPMRTPLIAANWKMFKTVDETVAFATEFRGLVAGVDGRRDRRRASVHGDPRGGRGARGSTSASRHRTATGRSEGAFTGEVSAAMIKDAGARYVIIGHSERRRLFGETDESVNRKLAAALAADLTPIVCVGETLEEREAGQTLAVLDRQIGAGLAGLTPAQVASLVIAYEPVWAIGTGRNATPAQADEAHAHIRARLREVRRDAAADACHILYGGSVKPDNIEDLMALDDVDGALVGGASLTVRSFFAIVSGARSV